MSGAAIDLADSYFQGNTGTGKAVEMASDTYGADTGAF